VPAAKVNRPVARAGLDDDELRALAHAIDHAPALAPSLAAYLQHACDHERARRDGRDFPLREPREAIPHEELRATFATIAALLVYFNTHQRRS
jgi:hypothetical protein